MSLDFEKPIIDLETRLIQMKEIASKKGKNLSKEALLLEEKIIMLENLRNIFYRMELSTKEIRILSGVFASLGKKRWLTKWWVSL